MFRQDQAVAVAELRTVVTRYEGNVSRAAHELGITRRHLYRLLDRANLWAEVMRIREAAKDSEPDWLRRTREVL